MTTPSFDLTGKVAIVTGGSKGIGRAIALGMASAGADVVVASRKMEQCETVAQEVRALGRRSTAFQCHVGDWNACEELVDRTIDEFGAIDVLVNNAGIAPVPPSLAGITENLFDKTIDVNLKGPIRLTGLAAVQMRDGGAIINISSKASMRPTPMTSVYSASKAALNAFTVAAAQELGARQIRVNAIVCGPFDTDSFAKLAPSQIMHFIAERSALGRIGTPNEVVGLALLLASGAGSYLTGSLVALDGGA